MGNSLTASVNPLDSNVGLGLVDQDALSRMLNPDLISGTALNTIRSANTTDSSFELLSHSSVQSLSSLDSNLSDSLINDQNSQTLAIDSGSQDDLIGIEADTTAFVGNLTETTTLAITAEANGSPNPSTVVLPNALTNGDFLISADIAPTVGDGLDEITSWTFDFTQDPNLTPFLNAESLSSAILTLELTPTTPGIDTDTPGIAGEGLPYILSPEVTTLPLFQTSTVSINLLDTYRPDQILAALQTGELGKIPMYYGDDALVSFAKIELIGNIPPIYDSGVFTVGESGQVVTDFLFDGGGYEGELALFSLEGMETLEPGSADFIQEAARRALTNSTLGHIVISDPAEGAKFSGELPYEVDHNAGEYTGSKTFAMNPGDRFGFMLIPDGWVSEVFENPGIGDSRQPLFSMSEANSGETVQFAQLIDIEADGNSFSFEDTSLNGDSDGDYNDLIFQVQGAIGDAALLDEVISPDRDWRDSEFGRAFINYLNYDDGGISTIQVSELVGYAIERASDLENYNPEELANTSQWAVGVSTSQSPEGLATLLDVNYLGVSGHIQNTHIFEFSEDSNPIEVYRKFDSLAGVEFFYPLVPQQRQPRLIPNDPLFGDQWHLQNTGLTGGTLGADANVEPAWDLAQGIGVVIGIVDDGLQHTHPDLIAQYRADLSFDFNGDDDDPLPGSNDDHGTAVAGVAAAQGNNGIGVSGAALNASLAGLRLTSAGATDRQEADALSHISQEIDIYNNSWGPPDNGQRLGNAGPMVLAAIENGISKGRNGSGNIYVWSAGNGLGNDDNVNYDGYANSRYVIAVSAVDHNGVQSSYSEPGSSILVGAYSNSLGLPEVTTTDLLGADGYSPDDYTNSFGGTSAAAPLVSGVIALMLEANPNLTWRDVQHILVNTAERNDPGDPDWTANGAGHEINHRYGFGTIDALAALNAALTWSSVEPETLATSGTVTINQFIPDNNPLGISSTVNINENINIESVEVVFDADHSFRGDLEVVLTSPDGTQSVLAEQHPDSNNNYDNWVFTSKRHWGESSLGDWTLQVFDRTTGEVGTWNSWRLNLYGTSSSIDEPSEFLTLYEAGQDWGADNYATSIAFGDINGDGRDEIGVTRNAPENARYFILDGDFSILHEGGQDWGRDNYATSIAFGDVDGDGRDEIGVTRNAPENARYFILDDDFSILHEGGQDWGGDNYATSIAFGDVDGDGRDETGIARKSDQNARYFILDDDFSILHEGGQDWGGDNYATSIAFGDVDNDFEYEIGVARKSDQNARYFILDNDFSILHEGGQDWGGDNYATSIAFGDVDGDGRDETGVTRKSDQNARYFVLRNDSISGFITIDEGGEDWGGDNYATSIAFGDVNGDALDDIGIARWTRDNARYLILNNEFRSIYEGGNDWGGGNLLQEPNVATSIAFGDINGDDRDEFGITRKAPENARYYILGNPSIG